MFKKLLGILLVGVFLYDVAFRPLELWYALSQEVHYGTQDAATFSKQPADNQLTEFKIPFSIPYASDWESSEEAEGLFQYEGDFYTIVDKQFKNDTITIRAIKNTNAREIFDSLTSHIQRQTDNAPASHTVAKVYIKLFFATEYPLLEHLPMTILAENPLIAQYQFILPKPETAILSPPPRS